MRALAPAGVLSARRSSARSMVTVVGGSSPPYTVAGMRPPERRRRDAPLPVSRPVSTVRGTTFIGTPGGGTKNGARQRRQAGWQCYRGRLAPNQPRPSGLMLVLSVEDLGHRRVLEDGVDGIGDDAGGREHLDLVQLLLGRERQGVGDGDALEHRVLQAVDGRSGEHAVG